MRAIKTLLLYKTRKLNMKIKEIWEAICDFFYYDIWCNLKDACYNTIWFFRNLKTFWSTLWNYRDWDHSYAVDVYKVMLKKLANRIANGNEERRSAIKKVEKIKELISLLDTDIDDTIAEYWNANVDTCEDKDKLYKECQNISWEHKKKIFRLIAGQDPKRFDDKYQKAIAKYKEEHPEIKTVHMDVDYNIWVELFDGSGAESWWE